MVWQALWLAGATEVSSRIRSFRPRNGRSLFRDDPNLTPPGSFFILRFAGGSPPDPARMSLFEGRWNCLEGQIRGGTL